MSEHSSEVRTYDNMALNTFQQCQQKYEYFIEQSIVPEGQGEALGFGIALHSGRESYKRRIMEGVKHHDAIEDGVQAYEASWHKEMPVWMKDVKKDGNRRGLKNGGRLLRGYLAKYGQATRPLYIEVPFAVYVGDADDGIPIIATGIIDEICEYQGQVYVLDLKTTTYEPTPDYFMGFRTSSAMMGYCVAVEETTGRPCAGAMIDAVWVRNIHSRSPRANIQLQDHFKSDIISYTTEQLDEWKQNVKATVEDITTAKKRNFYRRNWGDACKNYGGCEYRKICGATPAIRNTIIRNDYKKSVWNPLGEVRNDNQVDNVQRETTGQATS